MPNPPAQLSHATHSYFAVSTVPTFSPPPTFLSPRSSLPVSYVSPVGELEGEHLYSVAVSSEDPEYGRVRDEVVAALQAMDGATTVRVMEKPKMRSKRDEF